MGGGVQTHAHTHSSKQNTQPTHSSKPTTQPLELGNLLLLWGKTYIRTAREDRRRKQIILKVKRMQREASAHMSEILYLSEVRNTFRKLGWL
jgi:hypothetical protein